MRPKLLFLIADGMGDFPLDALDNRTPLMAAATPHMDALACRGRAGLVQTIPRGMEPGSDTANMALLGFDPTVHHTGRGPVEAAAKGLDLDPDDLVWRINLVTVSEFVTGGLMRDHSAGHIDPAKAQIIVEDLDRLLGDGAFRIHTGVQYRHLLVQKNGAGSPEEGLRINPPHEILDKPIAPDLAEFATAPRLDQLVRRAVERLTVTGQGTAANAVWPWGQGRPLHLPNFKETHGLTGAVITAVDLVRGLGRAAGMEVLDVAGATALLDTNYEGKAQAALQFLQEGGDFVYLHVEAPDECGHSGNIEDKIEAIRRFDERIVGPIVEALGDQAAYLIACDHLTPIALRTHVSDPAPFLFTAPGMNVSEANHFDEDTAKASGLTIELGHDLIPWCLKNAS